jgi:hypothetical protein
MRNPDPWQPGDPEHPAPSSRRGAVIGLLVMAILLGAALYLTHVLGGMTRLQDCVLSGRSNCSENP